MSVERRKIGDRALDHRARDFGGFRKRRGDVRSQLRRAHRLARRAERNDKLPDGRNDGVDRRVGHVERLGNVGQFGGHDLAAEISVPENRGLVSGFQRVVHALDRAVDQRLRGVAEHPAFAAIAVGFGRDKERTLPALTRRRGGLTVDGNPNAVVRGLVRGD